MDGELCAYCGKDDSFEELTREHFVPRNLWDDGHRPNGMRTVPTHKSCNRAFSDDDDYFRDVLVFEEGAKDHPEVKRLHDGPIKRKFEKKFGTIKKNLKNIGWYPVVTPAGLYVGHAPGFELKWERVQRFLHKVIKGVYWTVKESPIPQDWLFTIPRPAPNVFDENVKLIESMEPWQSYGDDVFCCRYCFHSGVTGDPPVYAANWNGL
jgi:hypothetical protein